VINYPFQLKIRNGIFKGNGNESDIRSCLVLRMCIEQSQIFLPPRKIEKLW